jgi:divalent metal cation (Fe/Co/Zn/Cd) transporter
MMKVFQKVTVKPCRMASNSRITNIVFSFAWVLFCYLPFSLLPVSGVLVGFALFGQGGRLFYSSASSIL